MPRPIHAALPLLVSLYTGPLAPSPAAAASTYARTPPHRLVRAPEATASARADSTAWVRWYDGLRSTAADPSRGARVENLTLTRDAGSFHLASGTLHLLREIEGRIVGAVFVGEGRFTMSAPDPVEQRQLERAYDMASLDTRFRTAVFLFTDFTVSELENTLEWGPLEVQREAQREIDEALDYVSNDDGWVSASLMQPMINGERGFFYAHFSQDRGDPTIFEIDPRSFEEVSLYRRARRVKRREVVARFHRALDYQSGTSLPDEALDVLSVPHYDIETHIDDDLDLTGRATARVRRLADGHTWIPFSLYSTLEVDSVRWADGKAAAYYRPEESSDLWVDFSSAPSEEGELTFHYSGDMMDRPENLWVQIHSHSTWFPVHEFGRATSYRLSFHVPEQYMVATVGTKLEESTEGEVRTTLWETPPTRQVTFNLGEFEEFVDEDVLEGTLRVLVNERAHRRLGGMVAQAGGYLLEQREMGETVAADLKTSFVFFGDVYGAAPVRDFVATEIPYSHGEAFPGLVLLAWDTFQWTTDEGFDEMFRAHEVAHQWWGIGVRPATYRDWWLAEGFADFSGLWYAARARGSVEMYERRLRETREALLRRRHEAAPMVLGQRAGTSEHPDDYQLMVYQKGAWVLHMLRGLLTDPDTGSDDAFRRVMNTFYTRHLGSTASTGHFQAVVEEVVGAPMDWFFQQWVYGTRVPTYTFSHRFEDQPDGSVKATVRVRQENVPEDFRMIVPILLDFGDEGYATVRVNVTGPLTEAELPLLPREPDEIVFNPNEAVLAETKTARWR